MERCDERDARGDDEGGKWIRVIVIIIMIDKGKVNRDSVVQSRV